VIFVLTTTPDDDATNYFTPYACAQGNYCASDGLACSTMSKIKLRCSIHNIIPISIASYNIVTSIGNCINFVMIIIN
jgi:hypothetical protein